MFNDNRATPFAEKDLVMIEILSAATTGPYGVIVLTTFVSKVKIRPSWWLFEDMKDKN